MATAPTLTPTRMNTFQALKLSRSVLLALDALLCVAVLIGASVHREAIETVGQDAAPSIFAAQQTKAALADMDADEANELLSPPNTANSGTAGVITRRAEADDTILAAARNITYKGEEQPIETLQVTGGLYNRIAQQAEDQHDALPPDIAALPDVNGSRPDIHTYRAESILMDADLLPAADDLDRVNNDALQTTYRRDRTTSTISTIFLILAGLASLLALIALQLFLTRRTNRILNPPLLLATLATFGLLAYSTAALLTEQHQLKIAKQEAFESIHALLQARALGYEANAEESRYLLDQAHAPEYQQAFFSETSKLAKLPPGVTLDEIIEQETGGAHVPGFTGYLADELNNITFPNEREAALRTLAAYATYLRIDTRIRTLEHEGKSQEAIRLCTSTAPGDSDWAFAQFDQALGDTIRINQDQFDRAIQAGISAVGTLNGHFSFTQLASTLEFKALLVSILIAILILLGLAPRIKEYD